MPKIIRLSPDEKEYIRIHGEANDISQSEMARWIGCNPSTIKWHLEAFGLWHKKDKGYNHLPHRKWNEQLSMDFLNMYNSGERHIVIGEKFDIKPQWVGHMASYLSKKWNTPLTRMYNRKPKVV